MHEWIWEVLNGDFPQVCFCFGKNVDRNWAEMF